MTGRVQDLTGKVFGELTARSITQYRGKRAWLCDCTCGNTRITQTFELNCGNARTCGARINHLTIKVGDRFEKLTITRLYRDDRNRRWKAECVCDCGNTHNTGTKNLQSGRATRCIGCVDYASHRRLPAEISLRNLHFGTYKGNAKTKGLEFNLTKEQFTSLTSSNCYFCGTPPKTVMTRKHIIGERICNGIDRIDSFLGYTIENCEPCCSECNYFKGNRSNKEFLSRIKQIYEHHRHR